MLVSLIVAAILLPKSVGPSPVRSSPSVTGRTPAEQIPDAAYFKKFVGPIGVNVALGGVTLGERAPAVRTRLGRPATVGYYRMCDEEHELWEYPAASGASTLTLEIVQGLIVGITEETKAGNPSDIADSFGIRLGDARTRLLKVRGKPSGTYRNASSYEMTRRVTEYYRLTSDRVSHIELAWDVNP
jgi:hypothetical protein